MINNVIHVINFRLRRYNIPAALQRYYLLTQNNDFLTTQTGEKIRL